MARFWAEFQRCTDSNKRAVHLFFAIDGSFLQAHIRRDRCRTALAVYRRGNNASGVARALTAGIKTGMLQVLKRKCVAHNANRRRCARLGRNK